MDSPGKTHRSAGSWLIRKNQSDPDQHSGDPFTRPASKGEPTTRPRSDQWIHTRMPRTGRRGLCPPVQQRENPSTALKTQARARRLQLGNHHRSERRTSEQIDGWKRKRWRRSDRADRQRRHSSPVRNEDSRESAGQQELATLWPVAPDEDCRG